MNYVPVNEVGLRIGEGHPRATLTDAEVERIRVLHEDEGMSYTRLAAIFEVNRGTVAKICRYERRGQTPANWKKIESEE